MKLPLPFIPYLKKPFVLLIVHLCGAIGNVYAQGYHVRLLGSNDGLSNNTILSITQDTNGYMWFGTLNSLVRYDGSRMIDYGGSMHEQGYAGRIVQCFHETGDGRLWVGSRVNGPAWFNQHTFQWNNWGELHCRTNVTSFINDYQSKVLFSTREGVLISTNGQSPEADTLLKVPFSIEKIIRLFNGQIVIHGGEHLWLLDQGNRLKPFRESGVLSQYLNGHVASDKKGQYLTIAVGQWVYLFDSRNNQVKRLHCMAKLGTIVYFGHQQIYLVDNGVLYIYSLNGILKTVFKLDQDNKPSVSFRQKCNQIFESRDGVVWLATDIGIVQLIPRELTFNNQIINSGHYARSIYAIKEGLLVGYHRDNRITLQQGNHIIDMTSSTSNVSVNCFFRLKGGAILAGGEAGIFDVDLTNKKCTPVKNSTLAQLKEVWSIWEDNRGRLWIGTHKNGLYCYHFSSGKMLNFKTKSPASCSFWTITKINNRLWFGTDAGLWYTDNSEDDYPFIKCFKKDALNKPITAKHIWQIKAYHQSILIGTTDAGLFMLDKDMCLLNLNLKYGFEYNQISSLLTDQAGNIWAGTMNGLYCFEKSGRLTRYDEDNGICHNDFSFNAAASKDQLFYFGNKAGITSFNPIRKPQWFPPNVVIEGVNFPDGKLLKKVSGQQLNLSHRDRLFSLRFYVPDYTLPFRIQYRYKLDGQDANWRFTDNRSAEAFYTNLSPGTYTFRVQARYSGNSWNGKVCFVQIIIPPPFWQTWWFRVCIGIIIVGFIVFLVYMRVRIFIRKKIADNELRTKISELELKALQAQMNPHFIFNALNAIQQFIFSRDERQANNYLTKFAQLMRLYLDSSKKRFVSVSQEITLLRLYMDLEELRFSGKIKCNIHVDSRLDIDAVEIPGMMIQPFVENAILHGLTPLKTHTGIVNVHIEQWKEGLRIQVIDNGVGINHTAKKSATHQSWGLNIIEAKMETLRTLTSQKVELTILDTGQGTHVEIILP